MRHEWVVRIILFPDQQPRGPIFECLRYAGLITIHRDDASSMCLDILPPRGVNSKVWADQNAERMATFGYNAVRAPRMWENLP